MNNNLSVILQHARYQVDNNPTETIQTCGCCSMADSYAEPILGLRGGDYEVASDRSFFE
mgnify:CR=1 FL=1